MAGLTIGVGAPQALNGPLGFEPSLVTVGNNVVVVAPVGDTDARGILQGPATWHSADAGASFTVVHDPTTYNVRGAPNFCSCDADLTVLQQTILATNFHRGLNPFFDANIVVSDDGGRTWQTRQVFTAEERPIDRPWLVAGAANQVFLLYRHVPGVQDIPNQADAPNGAWFLQVSADRGQSWSHASQVLDRSGEIGYQVAKPALLGSGTLVLPLMEFRRDEEFAIGTPQVGILPTGDNRPQIIALGDRFHNLAAFDINVATHHSARVDAVWSAPVDASGTYGIHWNTSIDAGSTWLGVKVLDLPGNALQPNVAVGPNGLAAVAYYGTDVSGHPLDMPEGVGWWPRLAILDTRDRLHPLLALLDLTPHDTFDGVYCNRAYTCPEGAPFRTPMAEFLSVAWSEAGDLVHIAFIDAMVEDADEDSELVREGRVTVNTVRMVRTTPSSSS